ncbi:MAG: histidine phosphatase family protein [Candidatus Saccharibacteria bacterium]|nr:histidine phosphatase family protein [Candidatus Saccharibacteria bacterium]
MKLILVRHGQTEENNQGIIIGQNPGKLSTEGIESAKKLAAVLKTRDVDYIVSSDLKRCVDTATILVNGRGLSVVFDERLREIDFGEYQGKPYSALIDDYGTDIDKKFPSGESNRQFITRVIDAVNEIYRKHRSDTVLIVSHSGVISIVLAAYHGFTFAKALAELKIGNATKVEVELYLELTYPA